MPFATCHALTHDLSDHQSRLSPNPSSRQTYSQGTFLAVAVLTSCTVPEYQSAKRSVLGRLNEELPKLQSPGSSWASVPASCAGRLVLGVPLAGKMCQPVADNQPLYLLAVGGCELGHRERHEGLAKPLNHASHIQVAGSASLSDCAGQLPKGQVPL